MHAKELHILAFHVALLNISKIVPVRVKICNENELRIMHRNAVARMQITCHSCI